MVQSISGVRGAVLIVDVGFLLCNDRSKGSSCTEVELAASQETGVLGFTLVAGSEEVEAVKSKGISVGCTGVEGKSTVGDSGSVCGWLSEGLSVTGDLAGDWRGEKQSLELTGDVAGKYFLNRVADGMTASAGGCGW